MQERMAFTWGSFWYSNYSFMKKIIFISILTLTTVLKAASQNNPDQIIGR